VTSLPVALLLAGWLAGTAGAQPNPAPDAPGHAQAAGTDSEFAAYDADQSGTLDPAEFSAWYQAKARQQLGDDGKAVSSADLTDQATQAFARADADRDQQVTREELTRFFAG